jgi:hypothetical protein
MTNPYWYLPRSEVTCAACGQRLWLPTLTVAVLLTPDSIVSDDYPVRPPTVYHFCSETCCQQWQEEHESHE